jgi:hypothetical protein
MLCFDVDDSMKVQQSLKSNINERVENTWIKE